MTDNPNWTIDDARTLYNVEHWGSGYFDINAKGELIAKPYGAASEHTLAFPELLRQLKKAGLTLPVLVRFSDILHDRVQKLTAAFTQASNLWHYQGGYTCVYPIKVNQQRRVVEQILHSGKEAVGLEAGSKPELMAILAQNGGHSRLVICNGYKDREYIRLALIGRVIGHRVFLIIEKASEVDLILEESRKMGIEPLLGVRVRLTAIGKGQWQNTGGERSKFGVTSSQLLSLIDRLENEDHLDALQLLHCHLGSQIASLDDIRNGLAECAQYYLALKERQVNIGFVDVGGGLGIDYEGTQSRKTYSINYSLEDYAEAVVGAFKRVCEAHGLPHPKIVTESGRALTAHHAVLITQVIDKDNLHQPKQLMAPDRHAAEMVQNLWSLHQNVTTTSWHETYSSATVMLRKCHQAFKDGELSLASKAQAEEFYYSLCHQIRERLSTDSASHRDLLDELNEKLADKLFCNFSLFQSIPDAWAIEQIFPVMPLQNLCQKPQSRAIIQDLTCDSDGCIHAYVDGQGIEKSLPLPPPGPQGPYCLGIFLVGAYQEILGDMHNLFGDTDSVHVEIDDKGQFRLAQPLLGDKVDSVLRAVHFDPQQLMHSYKHQLENAEISSEQRRYYLDMLASGLMGYTYLEEEV